MGGDDTKTYKQPDSRETEQFWQPRKHNKKYDKRIRRAQRWPESGNAHQFTQNDTKNMKLENARPWWNTWFLVQEIQVPSRRTSTRNELMPTKSTRTRMDDQKKKHIDPEGPAKRETTPNNYRPKTCLPMMWKISTAQIREEIYYFLKSRVLFPKEHNGCCKGSRSTGDLLYIDQHILNESKTRRKNLAMAWIDNRKAYDMVTQSWIINCFKTYKISDKVIKFIEKTMKP